MRRHIATIVVFVCAFTSSVFGAAEKIRIACVGDSITYGHGIKDESKKYPQQLGAILGDSYDVRNFGVSGRTMLSKGDYPYIKTGAYKNALAFNPNIVIIKLGTNDTKLHNWAHKGEFEKDMSAMIDAFSALPAKPRVYLCYPAPRYAIAPTSINEDRIFNGVMPMIRKIAKARGLTVINFHNALTFYPEYMPDTIHPNAEGARVMAELAAKVIRETYKK